MALVNPNIAMSFRQPEIQAPNALAQYAQLQQIQGGQQAQELNKLQIQEYQRAREEEEGTRNFLRGRKLSDPETVAGLAAFGKTGLAYAKQIQDQETAALNAKNTQSQIDERNFGLQKRKLDFAYNAIGSAPTPQAAIAEVTKGVKDGVFDMKSASNEIQQLQNMTPEQYQQYRVQKVMGILDAKDKLGFMLPKNVRQDAGGKILTIQDNPMLPGYGQPIAGLDIAKTATIGERTAQGQLNLAQQKFELEQDPNIVAKQVVGDDGTVTNFNKFGKVIGTQKGVGKQSATYAKTEAQKKTLATDSKLVINELTEAVKAGGLIDQSTGSGVGRLYDASAGFFGKATEGDIAIGRLQPIADLVLKTVPRFEGPQSDKDTASYKEAAGNLANPNLPREKRKAAANEIIRLMKQRQGQFITQDMATGATAVPPSSAEVRSQADAILNGSN